MHGSIHTMNHYKTQLGLVVVCHNPEMAPDLHRSSFEVLKWQPQYSVGHHNPAYKVYNHTY